MLTDGMFIADRYEVIGKIGSGGMSDVYKAKDHILGRNVAIKVLKKEFSEDRNFVMKFRTEAQSAAGLEHPNIVNIYDVGSEEGIHYIVMEYVEGITLKTYIEKKGKLSFKEADSIAIQIARGIETAHNKNIIHRDIKPQNIIISTEGKVKVTDFGIAKAISSNTVSADVMGSVHYTSPEHARNTQVDGRSDIYSLGIVMYEMVTGRVPFDGDTTVTIAIQHLQEEMVQPSAYVPSLPISMEKIILKCCQKSPERRYQTIGELLNDLVRALKTPDEDFVVFASSAESSSTRVITQDELKEIQDRMEGGEDDELENEEDNKALLNPKMNRAVTIMFLAVSAIIIILIIYIIASLLGSSRYKKKTGDGSEIGTETQQTETIEFALPDVTGLDRDTADKQLSDLGLKVTISFLDSDEIPPGTVIGTDPVYNTMLKPGDAVTVFVSAVKEEDYVEVPKVTGMTEKEAREAIEAVGLKFTPVYKTDTDVAKGKVISQSPSRGMLGVGQKVTVTISKGVAVPNVIGMTADAAKAALEKAGFTMKIGETIKVTDKDKDGTVIQQSEKADTYLDKGATITVNIAKYEKEEEEDDKDKDKDKEENKPDKYVASVNIPDSDFASGTKYYKYVIYIDGTAISAGTSAYGGSGFSYSNGIADGSSGHVVITFYDDDLDGDGEYDALPGGLDVPLTFTPK